MHAPALLNEVLLRGQVLIAGAVPGCGPGWRQSFKCQPRVTQSRVFKYCHEALGQGDCIGIFPEGGSHDRSHLIPIKVCSGRCRVLSREAAVTVNCPDVTRMLVPHFLVCWMRHVMITEKHPGQSVWRQRDRPRGHGVPTGRASAHRARGDQLLPGVCVCPRRRAPPYAHGGRRVPRVCTKQHTMLPALFVVADACMPPGSSLPLARVRGVRGPYGHPLGAGEGVPCRFAEDGIRPPDAPAHTPGQVRQAFPSFAVPFDWDLPTSHQLWSRNIEDGNAWTGWSARAPLSSRSATPSASSCRAPSLEGPRPSRSAASSKPSTATARSRSPHRWSTRASSPRSRRRRG
jgi:hypothetical protein